MLNYKGDTYPRLAILSYRETRSSIEERFAGFQQTSTIGGGGMTWSMAELQTRSGAGKKSRVGNPASFKVTRQADFEIDVIRFTCLWPASEPDPESAGSRWC